MLLLQGKDRVMNEYDIGESGTNEELKIVSLDRIDQTAVPLAAIPWPINMDLDPERHRTDIPLILLANDEVRDRQGSTRCTPGRARAENKAAQD